MHSNGHTPGTPCWLTHQITACCLHKLMKSAYSDYCTETAVISGEVHSFEAWCDSRKQQSPQFQFWYLVLSMELEILSLIRLFKEVNFDLYHQSLISWTNPILLRQQQCELRTMASHPSERHVDTGGETPQLVHAFQKEAFVVHKSSHSFSAIARSSARTSQCCH